MYRYHKSLLISNSASTSTDSSEQSNSASTMIIDSIDGSTSPLATSNTESDEELPFKESIINGAKFILKTRDGRKLTQSVTNEVVNDAKVLVYNTLETIKKEVTDTLHGFVPQDILTKVQSIFSYEPMTNPFMELETQKKQERFIQENFNYVVCTCTASQ